MKLLSSVFLLFLSLSLLCTLAHVDAGQKRRNKGGKQKARGKWTCEDDGLTFRTTARDLQKRVKLDCKNGRLIAGLTFVGHNGTCQGLTPDLFVQMSSCFWKSKCMFKYDVSSTNYMLKLFHGKASDCILKQPDTFTFSYNCTVKKNVTVLDIGGTDSQTSTAKGGVIRSHEDHPWLYRRSHADDKLTLKQKSKSKKHKHFAFTIHTLSLVEGDNLTVTAKTSDKTPQTKLFTANDKVQLTDAAKDNTYILAKATEVIFSLDASQFTNGGEGFVICFGWVKSKSKVPEKGMCKKYFEPKKCTMKKKKKKKKT